MPDCPFLERCPVFKKFKSEGLANYWISIYCKGENQDECERKKLAETNQQVPLGLLPNGTYLEVLES